MHQTSMRPRKDGRLGAPTEPMNLKGALPLLILRILRSGPLHGYAIARRIRAHSEGLLDFKEGTLCPALHGMENRGLIQSSEKRENGRVRRSYRLTKRGRRALKTERFSTAARLFAQVPKSGIAGARAGVETGGSSGKPRCRRIRRVTVRSVMHAITSRSAPHSQISTSTSNVRLISHPSPRGADGVGARPAGRAVSIRREGSAPSREAVAFRRSAYGSARSRCRGSPRSKSTAR